MILKTLANDFRMLLQTAQRAEQQWKNDQETIYRADKLYYFYSETGLLKKIVLVKNSKEKIIFEFLNNEKNVSQEVRIYHKTIPLTIKMLKIKL